MTGVSTQRLAAWGLLVVLSLGLHMWDLGGRTFHHDEAIHAKLSWDLARSGVYRYDPTYHGPLLYYLTAGTFLMLGDTDFTARLPIALAGVALLALAYALRRPFGERAAWWTGLLLTVSPTLVFFGRFLRMDVLELLTAGAALAAWYRAVHGSDRAWLWVGVFAGLAFATKENAYVTAALLGIVVCFVALDRGPIRSALRAAVWIDRHRWHVLGAASMFVLVTVPLYTFGFVHPQDWAFPAKAIGYWWNQHQVQRVGGPWWFHLPRLAVYEFLAVGAATVWIIRRWRRLRTVELVLFGLGVTSIGMYCYLGEKVPWLAVHQTAPFIPLAGAQLARTFGRRGRWWSRTLTAVALTATVATTISASFVLNEISPARQRVSMLHFVQTCPEVLPLVRDGVDAAGTGGAVGPSVSGEAVWPLNWYWRDVSAMWSLPRAGTRPPMVICDPGEVDAARQRIGPGYVEKRIPLRAWWLLRNERPTLGEVVRYVISRNPWSVVGSTDVVVLRRGEPGPFAEDGRPPAVLVRELNVVAATSLGRGWFSEPRGLAWGAGGLLVADSGLSRVTLVPAEEPRHTDALSVSLNEPEDAAWLLDGRVVVADTWHHRVVAGEAGGDMVVDLVPPGEGWYGPRSVAVSPEGVVAVADTGHRRIVVYEDVDGSPQVLGEPDAEPALVEPVGLTWLDSRLLLVCDTGNRRLVIVDRAGRVRREVRMPAGAWRDFYSRPKVVAVSEGRWIVSDSPGRCLWLIDGGRPRRIALGEDGLIPAGLAWDRERRRLYIGDLTGRILAVEVSGD